MREIIQFINIHPILSLIWMLLGSALAFIVFRNYFSNVQDITIYQAINLINKKNAVIVDLRRKEHFHKGHIIHSLNLTIQDIQSGNLNALKKEKTKPIIVVCSNGMHSRSPAQNLYNFGFKQVYILKEGISGWNEEHLPLVQDK